MKKWSLFVAVSLVCGCSQPESYDWFRSTAPAKIQMYYSQQCAEAGFKAGSVQNVECADKAMREGWQDAKNANAL